MHKHYLHPLDGLRFFAALFVMMAHYTSTVLIELKADATSLAPLGALSGMGMALFFCLSGFVIHYNYHGLEEKPQGFKKFFVARVARLYPLYLTLFACEMYFQFRYHRGSCSADTGAMLISLPYFLTLTQSWVYNITCQNALIYQYHMMSSVSWSVSNEILFYFIYAIGVYRISKCRSIKLQLMLGIIAFIALLVFFALCTHYGPRIENIAATAFGPIATVEHGYQDSLLRWLVYFNPLVNFVPFLLGVIAANIFLQKGRPNLTGSWQLLVAILAFIAAHAWVYHYSASYFPYAGRFGSSLYVPFVIVMIYLAVVYRSGWLGKLLSMPLLVKLGEASYSIYLLHAFFAFYARDHHFAGPWVMYILAIASILILSRLTYLCFERPMQSLVRKLLLGRTNTLA